jgi:hypothetical protein
MTSVLLLPTVAVVTVTICEEWFNNQKSHAWASASVSSYVVSTPTPSLADEGKEELPPRPRMIGLLPMEAHARAAACSDGRRWPMGMGGGEGGEGNGNAPASAACRRGGVGPQPINGQLDCFPLRRRQTAPVGLYCARPGPWFYYVL